MRMDFDPHPLGNVRVDIHDQYRIAFFIVSAQRRNVAASRLSQSRSIIIYEDEIVFLSEVLDELRADRVLRKLVRHDAQTRFQMMSFEHFLKLRYLKTVIRPGAVFRLAEHFRSCFDPVRVGIEKSVLGVARRMAVRRVESVEHRDRRRDPAEEIIFLLFVIIGERQKIGFILRPLHAAHPLLRIIRHERRRLSREYCDLGHAQ